MKKNAVISDCKKYRYALYRVWDESLPTVMFVGLNPSTADAIEDDPTINKCIKFAKSWGYGALIMSNLFAFRSTDPDKLKTEIDPIGSENDMWIERLVNKSDLIIAAWGNHGSYLDQDKKILKKFQGRLHCLQINKSGQPAHPLYLKSNLRPILL